MKTVKVLGLSLAVAIAGILAGCEAGSPPPTTYTSIQQCIDDGNSRDVCIHSMGIAMAQSRNAPHYATQADCVALYGPSGCQVQRGSDGSSWFTPVLEGFVIAQMLNGSGSCHMYNGAYCYNGYYSQPVYFNRTGGYSTVMIVNGRPSFSSAPVTYTTRVSSYSYSSSGGSSYSSASRATTTSRGGFGGGSSGGGFGGGG